MRERVRRVGTRGKEGETRRQKMYLRGKGGERGRCAGRRGGKLPDLRRTPPSGEKKAYSESKKGGSSCSRSGKKEKGYKRREGGEGGRVPAERSDPKVFSS